MRFSMISLLFFFNACATTHMPLPDHFGVLDEDQRGDYAYRATTPDGVVVGVKRIERRVEGGRSFWRDAVVRRLVTLDGYAQLSADTITSRTGVSGDILRLGRDLNGSSYRYTVAVYLTDSEIWVVEAGGEASVYKTQEAAVEKAILSLNVE